MYWNREWFMNYNYSLGWIVTLDVLKCTIEYENENLAISWIVTLDVLKFDSLYISIFAVELNSNIRCIEISLYFPIILSNSGWIVTLDVLK